MKLCERCGKELEWHKKKYCRKCGIEVKCQLDRERYWRRKGEEK